MVAARQHPPAFTLVEIIVATILLAVSLTVVMGLGAQSLSAQTRGREMHTAALLADEELNLVLATGPESFAKHFPLEGPCDEPFGTFRYRLEITETSPIDPYAVRVTISWRSSAGASASSLAISTLIASREVSAADGEVDPDPDRTPTAPPSRTE